MFKDQNKQEGRSKMWIFLLVFFIFSILGTMFGVLCIENTKIAWINNRKGLFTILTVACYFIFCMLCIWSTIKQKDVLLKIFLTAHIFILFCLLLIFIFQITGFFEVVNSAESLQAYIEKSGAWMPILYIVLQFLQVVLLPIPSFISTIAGLALFGAFKTMIFSLLGMIPASILAFFIGRKLGYKAVAWIVGRETLEKWRKKLKGKDNLFLTFMFLFPFFPDDVLCFLAGLSSMSVKYFLIMIVIARVIAVGTTCYSINFIPFNTWWGILIWVALMGSVIALVIFAYKNMEKMHSWLNRTFKKRKKDNQKLKRN